MLMNGQERTVWFTTEDDGFPLSIRLFTIAGADRGGYVVAEDGASGEDCDVLVG